MSLLGIEDPWIWGAYLLCILATVQCVIYGAMYWDKGEESEKEEIAEELGWQKKQERMEREELGEVL